MSAGKQPTQSFFDPSVPLEAILCTEELRRRASRSPDFEAENRALTGLVTTLANSKSDLLQTLVKTILDATGCDSAGISLLTDDGRHFHWPAIAGAWQQYTGGGSPRDCGPCGDALNHGSALLLRHLERRYTAYLPVTPYAVECLIIPFHVGAEAVGTIWAIMHTDRHEFDSEDERILTALGQFAAVASQTLASASVNTSEQSEETVETDLQHILNGIPGLVVTITADGEFESANEQVVSYTGRTVEQLKDWGTFFHPEDRSHYLNSLRASVETGCPLDTETRVFGADGVYRWFHQRGVPQTDREGRRICWHVLLTDIDKHKKVAERLRESEAFLLDAQGLSHTGSWKHDLASNRVTVTPEITRIYAVAPYEDATTAEFFFGRVHPEDRPGVAASYARSIEEKRDFASEFRIVLGDASIRYIHNTGHPKFNEGGELIEVLGTAIDVTEQTLARAELRAIINTIPTLAWSAGPDGSCDFLNQRWLDFTGLSIPQALGFGWSVVIHPDDSNGLLRYWRSALAAGTHVDTEARMRRFDGVYRWFLLRADPLRDEFGQIVKWYGTSFDIEDRKRAEDEVRQNEQRLHSIINTLPWLSWSTRPDGYCDFLSQRWLDFTGVRAEQVEGWGWSVVMHPEDLNGLVEHWQGALNAGTPVDTEARIRRFDGVYRWFLLRADPLRDEAGQIIRWYGSNVDIEDRKRAEDEVRQNERKLRSIINTIPTLSWSTRPDGYVEFLSERWLDFTGLSAEQAAGFGWAVAIHPEDSGGLLKYWQAALAAGTHVDAEARLRRSDGVYRWFLFRAHPLRDESGQITQWYGTNFDIEDRKQAEDEVRKNERNLRTIINAIPTLSWSTRADGYVEFLSHRWLDFTGLSPEEAEGFGWAAAIHPDDAPRLVGYWQAALASGTHVDVEARLRRFDGVYRWLLFRADPLRDESGQILKWYGTNFDIEDRKVAEEALRASERSLRESEHNLRLIVDTVPALINAISPQGELELVNKQMSDYMGRSLEEMRSWQEASGRFHKQQQTVVHPDDLEAVTARWAVSLGTGEPFNYELRLQRADGIYRWFQVRGLPLRDTEGNIVRWYNLHIDVEDRRRAEEALWVSEHHLRLIFDTIPALVCTMSAEGELELINRQTYEYFGIPLEDLKDWSLIGAVHPDDLEGVIARWRYSLETGERYDIDHRIRRADGVYRWFHVSALPLRDTNGRIARWYVLLVDSEDRHRAELALRASELNLRQMTETIPGMLFSANPEGMIDYCNARFLDYAGISAEDLAGRVWKAIHPEDAARMIPIWMNSVATGKPYYVEGRTFHAANQTYRWCAVSALPLLDGRGRILRWHGTVVDFHDRKVAEERLRRSEEYLAEAERVSHTGSYGADISADEHFWSDETFRIFGFDPSIRITTQFFLDRFHPEDVSLVRQALAIALEGKAFHCEARLLIPDHRIKHIRFIGHGTTGREDSLDFIGAVQDVTEQRLVEEVLANLRSELAHVARVSSLGALTASIAHEIYQPLSGIMTNAGTCVRMLSAASPNVEGALETARRTIRDGNRASDVITRLRALFSKKEAIAEPVDLNDATREVIALSLSDFQRNGLVLQTDLSDGLPLVTGDRVQLQQVVLNLVRNASDAMAGVDDRPRHLVIKTEREEGDLVRLSVQDHGVGFDPRAAERLFEAFYTTKANGMGIGLSISRAIIESHGGHLWALPNSGPGATVGFSVPRAGGVTKDRRSGTP